VLKCHITLFQQKSLAKVLMISLKNYFLLDMDFVKVRGFDKEKRKKGKKSCSDSVLIHVERYFEAECEKNFAE